MCASVPGEKVPGRDRWHANSIRAPFARLCLNKGFVCCGQKTFSGQLCAGSMFTIGELWMIVTRLVRTAIRLGPTSVGDRLNIYLRLISTWRSGDDAANVYPASLRSHERKLGLRRRTRFPLVHA